MSVENCNRRWERLCPKADMVLEQLARQYGEDYTPSSRPANCKLLRIGEPPFELKFTLSREGRYWRDGSFLAIILLRPQGQIPNISLPTPVLGDTLRDAVNSLLGQANLPVRPRQIR